MALLKVQALQGSPPAVAAGGHGKAVDGRNRPQLSHSPLGKPLRAFPQPLGKPADGFPTGTDPSTTTIISPLFSMRRPTLRTPRRLAHAGPLSPLLHHDPPSGNRPEFPERDRPDFLEPATFKRMGRLTPCGLTQVRQLRGEFCGFSMVWGNGINSLAG